MGQWFSTWPSAKDFSGWDFPRPDSFSQLKNEQKLFKIVKYIPNILVQHFGENFMKIQTKIAKLQMHENLHKNVNENMFSFTFLYKFSFKGQLEQLIPYIHVFLNSLKLLGFFRPRQVFSTLMVQMLFSQIQQAPGPDF